MVRTKKLCGGIGVDTLCSLLYFFGVNAGMYNVRILIGEQKLINDCIKQDAKRGGEYFFCLMAYQLAEQKQ